MEREIFNIKMQELAKEININFSVEQLDKFYNYMDLLLQWNEKMNLTAITAPEEIILKHFIDSLTILQEVKDNDKVVDVGTGAGFPGIPLSIMNESIEITLVDSLNKRLIFLQNVIENLNLKNVKIVHSRAEDFGRDERYREKFDIAVSRAVANLSTLSEYLIPLIKINAKCVCMKAGEAEEEISNAKTAIKVLGGEIKGIDKFNLPKSDIARTIVVIEKEKKTSDKYPRKAGIPSKEPIK